jgi:hypothetical protein
MAARMQVDRFGGHRSFGAVCFLTITASALAPLAGCNAQVA